MEKNTLEQRTEGNIVYSFATPYDPKADILYVNVVPKYSCVNSCRFCSRTDAIKGKLNIYEQKAGMRLYLPRSPSVNEIVNEIDAKRKRGISRKTREVAFVGLGEPLLEFGLVRDSIKGIRKTGYKGKIRLDTNGLVKCWYDYFPFGCLEIIERYPAKELRQAGLDEIRISVNATSKEKYQELCRSSYDNAFENLCDFVKDCIKAGIKTKTSFVTGFENGKIKSETSKEYKNFAVSLGIKPKDIILRKYIRPIMQSQ